MPSSHNTSNANTPPCLHQTVACSGVGETCPPRPNAENMSNYRTTHQHQHEWHINRTHSKTICVFKALQLQRFTAKYHKHNDATNAFRRMLSDPFPKHFYFKN